MKLGSIRTVSSFLTLLLGEMILISFGFVLTQLGVGVASGRHFEIGTVYTYDYVLGVELNEPGPLANYSSTWGNPKASGFQTGSTVGYKVLSQVHITPVWQSEHDGAILEIQVGKRRIRVLSCLAQFITLVMEYNQSTNLRLHLGFTEIINFFKSGSLVSPNFK